MKKSIFLCKFVGVYLFLLFRDVSKKAVNKDAILTIIIKDCSLVLY